jgi:hypothetical protein
MSLNFDEISCQTNSKKKIFGLCDAPAPAKDPAYIDEDNGRDWLAVVGNSWVETAIPQLKSTIEAFEDTKMADNFKRKLAYIANKQQPIFKSTQQNRMAAFFDDTNYVLRIQGRITL